MKNKLRGFALLELLGAIAVGSLLLIGLTAMMDTSVEDMKGQQAALYQSQVYNAAVQYIQTNYVTLVGASASTPIPLSTLTNPSGGVAPYLPPNFATTNVYGQTPCIVALQTAPNQLQALVVTYGGNDIGDLELATISANSGQGGGYISKANPTVAQGSSWSLSTDQLKQFNNAACQTSPGHLVSAIFFNGPGQLSTDFLYRNAVPNRPELNTMQTPLNLAGDAVKNIGDACTKSGIATDASNDILHCDGLTQSWQPISTWKPPVDDYANLPATTTNEVGEPGKDRPGDVRMVKSLSRAFTVSLDGSWAALAIDQNGTFTVPTNSDGTTGGNIIAGTSVTAGTNISAGKDLSAGHNLTVGHDANITNTMSATGISASSWAAAPGWSTGAVKTPGGACNYWDGNYNEDGSETIVWPTGSIAKDAQGIALSCAVDSTFRYENGTYTPIPPPTTPTTP